MFDRIKSFIQNFDLANARWFTVEFFRTIPLILLCLLGFWGDWSTLYIVKYVATLVLALALLSHLIRKVLFPYVKLGQVANTAIMTPLGAAIVFFGFCMVICTLLVVGAMFFK